MESRPIGPSPCSTNKDFATENPTPNPNTNIEINVGSSGTPETVEVQDESPTLVLGKKRRFISDVWNHFTYTVIDAREKALCNYCQKALVASANDGTRHLKDYFGSCPMRKYRSISSDFAQKKLKIKTSVDQKGKVKYGNGGFDEAKARNALSHMVIMHEYPLSIVDQLGFRRFAKALNSNFKMISRNTLKSDILKIFEFEKSKTMKLLGSVKSRVAITTDIWTAQNQRRGFIAITAHWVDNLCALQSRILRFAYVPCLHTADAISEELLKCFSEWNLSLKLSCLTVDNCSSNDAIITILLDRLDIRALPLKVASESTFSIGGRFVSPHRHGLHPKTLEALMCARDWLWALVVMEDEEEEVTSYRRTSFDDDPEGDVEEDSGETVA